MRLLVQKPIRLKKGDTLTEMKPGQTVEIRDPRKAEGLIQGGYLKPVPPPDSSGKPQAVRIFSEVEGPAYFKATYLRLVSDLDQAWPALPQDQKDRIFALVDGLDSAWLAGDIERFQTIIREIRGAASPVDNVQPRLFELAVGGGDRG
ncbi:MAG: hypothetical protein HZA19_04915 [Nitrospirae bacterium]|nr:hypothetical protein [Nitrospirota bacterium]